MLRTKEDIILLLLKSLKMLFVEESSTNIKGKIIIRIEKMSRIFFELENKFFSFNFPFSIEINDKNEIVRIYDPQSNIDLDNKIISELISVILSGVLKYDNFDVFFDTLTDIDFSSTSGMQDIWCLLKKLILFDCGYIRYDYDLENNNGNTSSQSL